MKLTQEHGTGLLKNPPIHANNLSTYCTWPKAGRCAFGLVRLCSSFRFLFLHVVSKDSSMCFSAEELMFIKNAAIENVLR